MRTSSNACLEAGIMDDEKGNPTKTRPVPKIMRAADPARH